jgi:predicted Zn-ribbon and HTH transcriptional regulator
MEANKLKCKCCGHEWRPDVSVPKVCPRCKSYNWREGPKRAKAVAP